MTDQSLQRVLDLAQLQRAKDAEVKDLEARLKAAKEELRRISDGLLPDLMLSFQPPIRFMGLEDGARVDVVPEVTANIPAISTCQRKPEMWDQRNAALNWFESSGNGDIVKHNIVATFGRDQNEAAHRVLVWLRAQSYELGFQVRDVRDVNHQTLEGFVREQLRLGRVLPEETLGVKRFNRAKITPPAED